MNALLFYGNLGFLLLPWSNISWLNVVALVVIYHTKSCPPSPSSST